MPSLYELSNEFLVIQSQLEELDLDQETLDHTLEAYSVGIEEKAENIVKYIKNLEAMAEARKAEAKRLTELASKDLKKAENLMNYLDSAMKMLGKKQLTAGVFELRYRKGSEVIELNEGKIPSQFTTSTGKTIDLITISSTQKVLSKVDLKKLLKDGEVIPGVMLVKNADKLAVK
jgi:hypothetical protein